MADGKKKQPMSLNQLHNRILVDLSASQPKISKPKLAGDAFSTQGNDDDDVPHFSFDSPSIGSGDAGTAEKKVNESSSSPELFAGIADFESPVSTLASGVHESTTITREDGDTTDTNPEMHADNVNLPGFNLTKTLEVGNKLQQMESDSRETSDREKSFFFSDADGHSNFPATKERSTRVKIEGRRRLCKIKDGTPDAGAGENIKGNEEPIFDEVLNFQSPIQGDKTSQGTGNEIRDILNDLSSKLESLSIQKNRIPKKVDYVEDFQESMRTKFDNMSVKEGSYEHQAAVSSSSLSPNSTSEVEYGDTISNQYQKNVTELKGDKYVAPSERHAVKKMNRRHDKFIEISDDESDGEFDDATILESYEEEYVLSGLRQTYRLQGKIAKMLYPHQRDGLKWLWSLHCKGKGGILGDDMGLGKTMQICGFIAGLFHSNLIRRVLIVAPKTLLTHWQNELSTVGLSGKTRDYFSTCTKTRHYELQYILQDKGVLLTTYDIVRNNVKSLSGDYHYSGGEEDEVTWDYMILDEGHLIKNPSTQRAKSLLQIPCRQRIIISGTPIQNNLKELWALFNFCCPELLGDKKEFKEKYEYFINRGNDKNASDREKRIGSSVAKDMRDRIQPYFLRRMKSEVFGDDTTLSKKNEIIVWLRLTQCQRQLYEAFLKSEIVLSACDGSPLAAITILKKICDHPLLLTKRAAEDVLEGMDSIANQDDVRVAENLAMHIADVAERFEIVENSDISCKLSFVMSLLADLIPKGHNVLIFSQTRKMLNLIQDSLTSNNYKYQRIDGTTKPSERATIVKDFQEGHGAPIFLLTSQVGGLGLTLTNADRVIVVDPAWNPSTDNQSVDRAYRIGQKKDVIVYRLMTCGTVEEKIYKKQVFKGGLFRSATEHKEQVRYFSQQDLKDLFSLPKQGFDISLTHQQLLEEHDHHHKMEESLKAHVDFLETLNIAGVSQHSLLFSKAAPVQAIDIDVEKEVQRIRESSYTWNRSSASSSLEPVDDGARFAFNPKDLKKVQSSSPSDVSEPTEAEIKERINRLAHIFSNKAAVSKLPDKGEKIQKQIAALNLQLDQIRVSKGTSDGVILL